jgi:cytochrome c553
MRMFLVAAGLSAVLMACTGKDAPTAKGATETLAAADAAAGKRVAERDCSGCHGLDGRGAAPGIPHLGGQRERYLVAALTEYQAGKRAHAGRQDMAAKLSEADRRDVAAYYASAPPMAPVANMRPAASPYDEGKALAAGCAKCHGDDGNSAIPGTPSLAGQQPRYLLAAIHAYQSGERTAPAMRSALSMSDTVQLEKLGLYFASQTPVPRPAPRTGNVEAGRAATRSCAGCHGADGVSGDASIPNLAGQDPGYLAKAIKGHRTSGGHWGMQRYVEALSAQDAANIAAFFAAQAPPAADRVRLLSGDVTEKCDRCHDVADAAAAAPMIRGQDRDYLLMTMRAYRDGKRESSTMHNMRSVYGSALIDGIATWYASQAPK